MSEHEHYHPNRHDEDEHYGRSRRGREDRIIDREDAHDFAHNAFRSSAEALSNAEVGKEKKFLGISMDAGVVDALDGIYNMGAEFASTKLRPKAFKIADEIGPKLGLSKHASKNAAAVAAIGSTVFLKAGNYFGGLYKGVSEQIKERRDLARELAPVLDDIKGNHSVAALYSTGENNNEVIYAHRQRLARIAKTENMSNLITLGINTGTSLAFDVKGLAEIAKRRQTIEHTEVNRIFNGHAKSLEDYASGHAEDGKQLLKNGMLGLLPQAGGRIVKSSEYKLAKELSAYSSWEMIRELNEQFQSDPHARSFQMPASYENPHGHRDECSLEEYIMKICIRHQKDMADLNTKHSEIREALREDLADAVKPIAQAIRKGDLSVLSLVRLVGEGHIIKKQGRAIASVDEVKAYISKEAPKQSSYTHEEPAEYYKSVGPKDKIRETFGSLKGEARMLYAENIPDNVMADLGISKKEIKQVQQFRTRGADGKGYDHDLACKVMGLEVKGDKALGAIVSKNEVAQLHEVAEQIGQRGVEAVRDFKASAVNPNGIEKAISTILTEKPNYLGTILKDGQKRLAEAAVAPEAANDSHYETHAERQAARRTGTDDVGYAAGQA